MEIASTDKTDFVELLCALIKMAGGVTGAGTKSHCTSERTRSTAARGVVRLVHGHEGPDVKLAYQVGDRRVSQSDEGCIGRQMRLSLGAT